MRHSFLLSIFILAISLCNAQVFLDNDEKIVPKEGFVTEKYVNLRQSPKDLKCDGGYCSEGNKYDKITYTLSGIPLYTLNARYNWEHEFLKKGAYYASNDQLFLKNDAKKTFENPVYYENGNFWNGLVEDEEDHGLMRLIELSPEGAPLADIPYKRPKFKPAKDDKYGMREEQYHIRYPKMYAPSEGNWYYGYDEVGYFRNGKYNYIFTGFFLPMISYYSNGTVLFMEDLPAQKNYWAVVLDNEVKFKMETDEESPDMVKLKENTNFEHSKLVGPVPYAFSKNFSKRGGLQYHDNHCFNLVTKNISTLNGYGINYTSRDNKAPCDELYLEVGQFKNGKLHGVGMRSQIIRGHDARYDWNNPSLAKDDDDFTIHIAYGLFEDGEPVDVRRVDVEDSPNKDFWDVIPIAGFTHKNYQKPSGTLYPNMGLKLSTVKPGDEIFIEEILRVAKVSSVNLDENYLTVYTDTHDVRAKFDASYKKPLYLKSTTSGAQRKTCPATLRRDVYRRESKQIGTTSPTVKTDRYVVKGVYYDKVVRTTITSPAQPIYGMVNVYDGYEEYTCPACNGRGYVEQGFTNYHWQQIAFN